MTHETIHQPTELKLLTFGCPRCRNNNEKMLRDYYEYALTIVEDPNEIIVPEFIRCGWCRRNVFVGNSN